MSCAICGDRGYLLTDDNKFSGFCSCSEGQKIKTFMWQKTMQLAGIPREYWTKEVSDLYVQPLVKHHKFVDLVNSNVSKIEKIHDTSSIWAIYGDSGTGKTLGGILVLKEALRLGYTVKYVTWTTLLECRLRKSTDDLSFLDMLKQADFICIDEVGEDSMNVESKFPNETLEGIIKERYSNKKPTILILADDFTTVSRRLRVIMELVPASSTTEVRGMNYRLNKK